MLMQITNSSGRAINVLETMTGGVGPSALYAQGGNVTDPLPYPFGHIGTLAIGAAKTLPMHLRDWHHKSVPWLPMDPSREWQQLVQAGVVSMLVGVEAFRRDEEEIFATAV